MEWGILAALLLMIGPSEPSHKPRLVVLGPCCSPQDRQAEPDSEPEASG